MFSVGFCNKYSRSETKSLYSEHIISSNNGLNQDLCIRLIRILVSSPPKSLQLIRRCAHAHTYTRTHTNDTQIYGTPITLCQTKIHACTLCIPHTNINRAHLFSCTTFDSLISSPFFQSRASAYFFQHGAQISKLCVSLPIKVAVAIGKKSTKKLVFFLRFFIF